MWVPYLKSYRLWAGVPGLRLQDSNRQPQMQRRGTTIGQIRPWWGLGRGHPLSRHDWETKFDGWVPYPRGWRRTCLSPRSSEPRAAPAAVRAPRWHRDPPGSARDPSQAARGVDRTALLASRRRVASVIPIRYGGRLVYLVSVAPRVLVPKCTYRTGRAV